MVRNCCVNDCTLMPTPAKVHYFSFPKVKIELWKQILLLLNNQEYEPKSSSKICVKHFKPDCILYNFGKISLSAYANPTLFHNSPINASEVIDYLISQNAEDPLAIIDNPEKRLKRKVDVINKEMVKFPRISLNSNKVIEYLKAQNTKDPLADHPKKSLKRKADNEADNLSIAPNDDVVKITRITKNSPKRKLKIVENSSEEKRFSNSRDVFKNMEDITDWTLTEMKEAFNVLKSTLDQRSKQIQALSRKNNRLESLLARFCVDDLNEKQPDGEICKICLKRFPRESNPFYLNVQITDKWLPTFLNKFKSCSGDILLTKIDKIVTPVCDLCLQHVLANYSAVFSDQKEEIKNPIINVDIKENLRKKIIPEEVVNKITENTTGKVIILKKISRSKIPNNLKQITRKKLEVTPNNNPSKVNIIRTTMKDVSKPKLVETNKRKEPGVSDEAPISEEPTSTENTNSDIICEYCGESFTDKKIHLQHQSTHWADMKFVCNNCDTCFLTDSDLELHKVIHCKA